MLVSRIDDAPEKLSVRRLARLEESDIAQLAEVLVDCAEGGASVSFMHPLTPARPRISGAVFNFDILAT
jgi:hypothetical protein